MVFSSIRCVTTMHDVHPSMNEKRFNLTPVWLTFDVNEAKELTTMLRAARLTSVSCRAAVELSDLKVQLDYKLAL